MALLVTFLALALSISFLCSLLEAVLLSMTPSYEHALSSERPKLGEQLTKLRADIDRPLAAILILNTVAHTVGAAGVGAQAAEVFGSNALAIASAIMTVLILVVSEIIPKTLGATYWRRLTPSCVRILGWLMVGLWPLIALTRGLSSWIGRGSKPGPTVSRAELRALAAVAVDEGVVSSVESRIFRNLLRFRSVEARDIMTPRPVIVAFDHNTTAAEAIAAPDSMQFSRFPVYDDTIDNVTGFALKQEMMLKVAAGEGDVPLSEIARPIVALSETEQLPELLQIMLRGKEHIVLLTEDLGGTAGIASLEDVVETLLGIEIVDETDTAIDMRELAREKWAERARRKSP